MAVQIPILDLRSIVRQGTAKLSRPNWPDPIVGVEFIRSVGGVKRRPAGPIDGWDGEIAFCEAGTLVKFDGDLSTAAHSFTVVYRRLFGFGHGYRLDLGFVAHSSPTKTWKELAEETLRLPVVVAHSKPREMRSVGPVLAHQLAWLTTPKSSRPPFSQFDLVPGMPVIRVESLSERRYLKAARVSDQIPCYRLAGPGKQLRSERRLRGILWRLHTELEFLRALNRVIRQHKDFVDPSEALDLISDLTSHLAHKRRYGIAQPPLIALATAFGRVELHDLMSLAEAVNSQSAGVARRLQTAVERAEREMAIEKMAACALGVNVEKLLFHKGDIMVDSIRAGKNSVVNYRSNISDSFNRLASEDSELHQALDQISQSVNQLHDPSLRTQAEELVDTMVGAADSGERSVFKACWHRLQEIAPVIGAGAGVTAAVTRFLGAG